MIHFVQEFHADDTNRQNQFYEWFKSETILADDVMFSDDTCLHLNRHNIVQWAHDKPHVAADVHHQTNPSINVWCVMHGNTCWGLLFLGGG